MDMMEEILCELERDDEQAAAGVLPPGFRFHPTDEELITFYLASKVFNNLYCCAGMEIIAEVDLNRCEPWELPDVAKMGEREWYFFSLRDRKYPTGLRTNRATNAGYWKATGKDRQVYNADAQLVVGMKKTLVFYRGRAPRGQKTKWVMHEYRLLLDDAAASHTCKEEWVICRIYHKMNEKKIQNMLQCQNYSIKPSPFEFPTGNNTSLLPPLLEQLPTLSESQPQDSSSMVLTLNQNQNPFLDLKSFISPQRDILAGNSFSHQLNSSVIKADKSNMAGSTVVDKDSLLFKHFLSDQDLSLQELNSFIAKQCKKEAGDAHFELVSCKNMQWPETNKYQNSAAGDIGLISSGENIINNNVGTLDAVTFNYVMSNEQSPRLWLTYDL